jgi:phosphomannomutase
MENYISAKKRIDQWLTGPYDEDTKNQIKLLLEKNLKKLLDDFSGTLNFGTGGIRAKMDVGTNRLNTYTISVATQALCNYVKKHEKNPSILIGFDNRKNSNIFAEVSARVIAANQIKAYLFKELRPTPIISFGCRYKNCSAAIMITASHNPKDYNGFKVYWKDGGQVLFPHDISIVEEYNKISSFENVKILLSLKSPLIELITDEIDNAYMNVIFSQPPFNKKIENPSIKIVYSNLHGTGITLIPKCLKKFGFENIMIVKEQEKIDPDFTNAPNPNPEEPQALEIGISQYLLKNNADIFLSNDPDADRMGVVINVNHEKRILTGNEVACIILDYLCKTRKLTSKTACIKTIVTTELLTRICENYEIHLEDVLTGFKYIAEKINEWEQDNSYKFLFGAEESLGYLIETSVRDKDAISASLLISKIADDAKKENKTLLDLLYELFEKHGVYREKVVSISFEYEENGIEKMKNLMKDLREKPLEMIGNYQISYIDDFLKRITLDLINHQQTFIALPSSDVLRFWLSDSSKITIRPSGTEPKLKIYVETQELNINNLLEDIKKCDFKLDALINATRLQINI